MSEELKPCPFCGATDNSLVQSFTRASDDFSFWSVECYGCGAEIADDESQEAADKHWNTRATEAALRAENELMREALAPFAAVAEHDIGDDEGDADWFRPMEKHNHAPRLTVGHFRNALAQVAK